MNCILRKWRLSDAEDLAALNNEKVLNNLRDGLPFPHTDQGSRDCIAACFPQTKTVPLHMPSCIMTVLALSISSS